MNNVIKVVILSLHFLFWAQAVSAFEGTVVAVVDGDTLIVNNFESTPFKIRLAGIDAPEKSQAWGKRSKDALVKLVLGKTVTVEISGLDSYNRHLGTVFVDRKEINIEMVRTGDAWVYLKYCKDPKLIALQNQAKSNRVGLWSLPSVERVAPWEFRKSHAH